MKTTKVILVILLLSSSSFGEVEVVDAKNMIKKNYHFLLDKKKLTHLSESANIVTSVFCYTIKGKPSCELKKFIYGVQSKNKKCFFRVESFKFAFQKKRVVKFNQGTYFIYYKIKGKEQLFAEIRNDFLREYDLRTGAVLMSSRAKKEKEKFPLKCKDFELN